MSFENSKWIWLDGRLVPWASANIHISSHALHYGSGVFEGIRCYRTDHGPALFRIDDHLIRLEASASIYGLRLCHTQARLREAIEHLILENGFDDCYVRPLVFYGSSALTIHPYSCPTHIAILAWPWDKPHGSGPQSAGLKVGISTWVKLHSSMIPTTAKATGQYLNGMLAIQEASRNGCDEALLLDINGNVAEGSGENLFLVHHGTLTTNEAQDSILPGITRDTIISIAQELGYEVLFKRIGLDDLVSADEAFFCGTAVEITPIREIAEKRIWETIPGPVTKTLQDEFRHIVRGGSEKHRKWLHWTQRSTRLMSSQMAV